MGRGASTLDTSKWFINDAVAKEALSGMITIPPNNCGKELWIVTQESLGDAPVIGSVSFDGKKVVGTTWASLDPVDLNKPSPSVTDIPMGLAWDPQTGLLIAQAKMTSQQLLYGAKDVSTKGTLQGIPGVNDPQTEKIIPIGGDVKWDGDDNIATYYTLFGSSASFGDLPVNKMYSMVIDWEAVVQTTTSTTISTTTSKKVVNEAMASNLRSLTSTVAFPWTWSTPEAWTPISTAAAVKVKATVRDIAFSTDGTKLYGVGSVAAATKAESMFEDAAGGSKYVYTMTADGTTISTAVEVDIPVGAVSTCEPGSPWRIESVAYLDGKAISADPMLVMLVKDLPPTTTSTKAPSTKPSTTKPSTTKPSTTPKPVTKPPPYTEHYPYKCGGIYTITVSSVTTAAAPKALPLTLVLQGVPDKTKPYANSNNYLGIATCRQTFTPTINLETTTTTTTITTTPTPTTTTAAAVVTTKVPITKPSSASAMIGGIGCVVMTVVGIM